MIGALLSGNLVAQYGEWCTCFYSRAVSTRTAVAEAMGAMTGAAEATAVATGPGEGATGADRATPTTATPDIKVSTTLDTYYITVT